MCLSMKAKRIFTRVGKQGGKYDGVLVDGSKTLGMNKVTILSIVMKTYQTRPMFRSGQAFKKDLT